MLSGKYRKMIQMKCVASQSWICNPNLTLLVKKNPLSKALWLFIVIKKKQSEKMRKSILPFKATMFPLSNFAKTNIVTYAGWPDKKANCRKRPDFFDLCWCGQLCCITCFTPDQFVS